MAASATDSVQAEALLQYMVPACEARYWTFTQSKPAPAEV
jgi:hypothetical protein